MKGGAARLDTMRWRLPLSYGALALLTVGSLGLVLLLALRGFYARQESAYLARNGQAVSVILADLLPADPSGATVDPNSLLQTQIDTYSYLTQTQVRVRDADGQLLADSGDPRELRAVASLSLQVQVGDSVQAFSQTIDRTDPGQGVTSVLVIENESRRFQQESAVSGGDGEPEDLAGIVAPLSLIQTPFGGLGGVPAAAARSPLVLSQPILASDGTLLGTVELSQGPSFGRVALPGVAWGFALAGSVAVILSAVVGWLIGRRVSRPVEALAALTERMARGELHVRAPSGRGDELGRLSASFNHMAAQVETTIATLRRFVADAAHELNTPIAALRANLEMAGSDSPYLQQARAQAVRLERLSDDLLRLSRLESGIEDEAADQLDLADMLRTRGEQLASQVEQGQLTLRFQVPDEPVPVLGRPRQLQQVVDNLMDNAVKFTPAGGEVTLRLAIAGDRAVLTVTDTGIGLDGVDAALLFGRFHRGRNAVDYPGSGLGLAIARAIVHAHGGAITAGDARPGTRVVVDLPLIMAPGRP